MKSICCIGHITLDKITTPKQTIFMAGGTSFYFSHAISRMKDYRHYKLVTSLAESEFPSAEAIRKLGIEVKIIPSLKTVYFENIYGDNPDERTQRVLAKADPFTIENLQEVEADIYHLGTLLADDFSLDTIKYLSQKGILSADAQGYLREVHGEKVHAVDWKEKREALKYIDILKVNEKEMEVLTGYNIPEKAATQLAEWGVKEVIITLGSLGSLIYTEGNIHRIPSFPPKEVVDATGCGDTYMAGYLYMRSLGASYQDAGYFAAAMSTLKLEHNGPFCESENEIYTIINAYGPLSKHIPTR